MVIKSCDSQVSNTVLADGCTISDEIDGCAANAGKHGSFQSCISDLVDGLQKDHVLTGREKKQVLSCAGQSELA